MEAWNEEDETAEPEGWKCRKASEEEPQWYHSGSAWDEDEDDEVPSSYQTLRKQVNARTDAPVDDRCSKRSKSAFGSTASDPGSRKGMSALTAEERRKLTRVPKCLEDHIGLSFTDVPAKQSVHAFFRRYLSGQDVDFVYECERKVASGSLTGGVVARLRTPSFYGRVFTGPCRQTKKEAIRAAAEVFIRDAQVLEAARSLPPAIDKVRRHITTVLEPLVKYALVQRGVDLTLLMQEAIHALYQAFQEKGCRTALWDSNL